MDKIIKFLEDVFNKKIYISDKGCTLINHAQEMIARERIVVQEERNILIPGCGLQLVDDVKLNAFTTKIEDEYWIFVNRGIIEEQKLYLETLDWSFISDAKKREQYIDDMIEYGFYFIVFHEYAHIFCGHVDARLNEPADKKAQECEADMVSMDYLIKYVEYYNDTGDYSEELTKLFLAIYFLFEKMQKQNEMERYNDKIIQNYYDPDRIEKRDHPLDAQRILYLYDMLNIVIVTDKIKMLPVKEEIINILKSIKRLSDVDLPKREMEYLIAEESIQNLKKTLQDIRVKIPRLGSNSENQ